MTANLTDIDGANSFQQCRDRLLSATAQNFLVDFDAESAACGINVTAQDTLDLVQQRGQRTKKSCLWINLWGWNHGHSAIVKVLAKEYGISPRLAHTMCPTSDQPSMSSNTTRGVGSEPPKSPDAQSIKSALSSSGQSVPLQGVQEVQQVTRMPTTIAEIAQGLWNYCTVDFGESYVCICWNALFFVGGAPVPPRPGKPGAIRIWSSLLICSDGTVCSTFECPPGLDHRTQLKIRQNQLNIFSYLSRHGATAFANSNALLQIKIRSFDPPSGIQNRSSECSEMASLLFYYLFDDWLSICYQAIGGQHSYRSKLQALRDAMEESASVHQITSLHTIGRELTTVRAIYKSYQSILERLVRKHRHSRNAWFNGANAVTATAEDATMSPNNRSGSQLDLLRTGFDLATSAIHRFERLQDRITLMALTEVEECLKEKDDLAMLVSTTQLLPSPYTISRPSH